MANASKKVLGAGLNDLFSELREDIKTYEDEGRTRLSKGVEEIDINLIDTNPDQPRKTFDDEALHELANSIRNFGVLQPLIVCKVGGRYIIVAGERRYRASKIAGLHAIPVIVKNFTEQERKEIALIENLQRQDLNPIEESLAIRALMDEYHVTQEQLALRLGKSRPAITNALRLLSLCPEVIEMVKEGRLSAGHARALVPVKTVSVQIAYAKAAADKGLSVRALEAMVYAHLHPEDKNPKKRVPLSAELKDMVDDMKRIFATKVKAVGTNMRGRIYIDYYTRDDLERIYSLMEKLKNN